MQMSFQNVKYAWDIYKVKSCHCKIKIKIKIFLGVGDIGL
jgi:hypothetical protein